MTKALWICVLTAGALVVTWAFMNMTPPVSLTVRGFTVKRRTDDIAQWMGSTEYVCARVELINSSGQPVTYWARDNPKCAEYTVLHQTPAGWKEPAHRWRCGTGIQRCTLAPSQTITFDAVVDPNKLCKVALNYSDGRTPSRLWRRLPQRLVQKLPWGKSWSTVSTDPIDLRNAEGLTAEPQEASSKSPEDTPSLRLAR